MELIKVKNLCKTYRINVRKKGFLGSLGGILVPEYKNIEAVNNIDFTINKGDMVGFIGPNGAGKSTTIKMLTGILVPTSGEISIGNLSPHKDRIKNTKRIGVVFGQRSQLWWDLPVYDTFSVLKHIYNIPNALYNENIEMFNELLGLKEFVNQPVRQLSLGQRMRADIAAALLHNPEIVFFDEPTIGLDVVAKENIREFIKHINKLRGVTMLFTTHDMLDIEKTCQKMIIIDNGKIIYNGTISAIKDRYSSKQILIAEFNQYYPEIDLPSCSVISETGNKKFIQFDKLQIKTGELITILNQKYDVIDFTIREPEIEGIIREIYQGGIVCD